MDPAPETYNRTAVILHWLIAALIGFALVLGFYMHDLPLSPAKLRYYSYHKWVGITVLLLAVLRVAWRLTYRPPLLPASMSRRQRAAAAAVHGILYLLIVAVPLSGWLMSSAKGFQTIWFGVLPLPDLLDKDKELGVLLSQVHMFLDVLLATLVVVHLAAALRHHFVANDAVLSHMLPFLRQWDAQRPSAVHNAGEGGAYRRRRTQQPAHLDRDY